MGKKSKQIAKKDRRNQKLWAEGAREQILLPHVEPYTDALDRGWVSERDYVQKVCNEYHTRIDWRLEDHEEPPLPLKPYDPNVPGATEELNEDEQQAKRTKIDDVNQCIRHWLKYRALKLRSMGKLKMDPRKNPYAMLLAKLSGITSPPKARQAVQQYSHENYQSWLKEEATSRWETEQRSGRVPANKAMTSAFRASVTREHFNALDIEERTVLGERAKEEAAKAKVEYEKALKNPPSKSPESRQEAIDKLGTFLGPILQGIYERTGLHSVVVCGGPMPKDGGDIQTIHIAYGKNNANSPVHFPQWDRQRFQTQVIDFMREYLRTAFTEDDCKLSALTEGFSGAKYRIDPNKDDSEDESDSDDSDSKSDLDAEASRKKKKAKTGEKRKRNEGERSEGSGQVAGSSTAASPTSTTIAATPGPISTAAPAPARKKPNLAPTNETEVDWDNYKSVRAWNIYQRQHDPVLIGLREEIRSTVNDFGVKAPINFLGTGASKPTPKTKPRPRMKTAKVVLADSEIRRSSRLTKSIAGQEVSREGDAAEDVEMRDTDTDGLHDEPMGLDDASKDKSVDNQTSHDDKAPPINAAPVTGVTPPMDTNCPPDTLPPAIAEMDVDNVLSSRNAASESPTFPTTMATSAPPVPAPINGEHPPGIVPNPVTGPSDPIPSTNAARTTNTTHPFSDTAVATAESVLASAPAWLKENCTYLSKIPLGGRYDDLMTALVRLEEAYGFVDSGRKGLEKDHRPEILTRWIANGRARGGRTKDFALAKNEVSGFVSTWWKWWEEIQPQWRVKREKKWERGSPADSDWEVMALPGPNGMLSVIATLYWWGCTAAGDPELEKEWEEGLLETGWVLSQLERQAVAANHPSVPT